MTNVSSGNLPVLPTKTIFELKNKVRTNLDHSFSRYLDMKKIKYPKTFYYDQHRFF